jgi:hypothetical protein
MITNLGKPKHSEIKPVPVPLSLPQNPHRSGLGFNPFLKGKGPAMNRQSLGTGRTDVRNTFKFFFGEITLKTESSIKINEF